MPKITACVIVKNEEKNLPRWLSCVKKITDDILVTDTGSTDGTERIATEGGARVLRFKWVDDFSAAKNFAIEHSRGDWIVFLDADEYFSANDSKNVLELIRRFDGDKTTDGFDFRWVNIDESDGNRVKADGTQIRVFRSRLRYTGRIHERLEKKSGGVLRIGEVPDITIWHTGYSGAMMPEKVRRNLRILQADGEKPENYVFFADCYFALKDYENAADYAVRAMNSPRGLGLFNRPEIVLIQSLISLKRPLEEITAAVKDAGERFPYHSEFLMMAGCYAYEIGEYDTAEGMLLDAVRLYGSAREKVKGDMASCDYAAGVLPNALACLANISHMKGDDPGAAELAARGIAASPMHQPLISFFCRLLRKISAADFIGAASGLCGENYELWAKISAREFLGGAALYFEKKSGRKIFSDRERYMFAGKYSAAAGAAADDAAAALALGLFAANARNISVELAPFMPKDAMKFLPPRIRELTDKGEPVCQK